jgi:hypothetical protein
MALALPADANERTPEAFPRPEVRAFWTGPELSPYEELSLKSFVAAGARVLLYSPNGDLRVPDGVELVDVDELLSGQVHQFTFPDGDRSPALHSDLFRYVAMQRFGGWYADLDIVCIGKDLPKSKVYLARESDGLVNGAVMKFPAQSPVIAAAIEEAWKLLPETKPGAPLSARISIGPSLVTQLVRDYALDHIVRPRSSAYEIGYDEIPAMFDPNLRGELDERTARSDFIHLWNEIWRRVRIPKNYGPPAGSFLDGLFSRFGIQFAEEARLSAEAVAVWFQERQFLEQARWRLGTDVIPTDGFNLLMQETEGLQQEAVSTARERSTGGRTKSRLVAAAPQTVRTLWQGGHIGAYQLLCLRSFVDRGHRVEVFSFDPALDLPDWIERKNAADIVPAERILRYLPEERRSAIHANLFRYALLHRLGGWWVDPDVLLLRTELPAENLFFSGPTEFNVVSTAAIKFPSGHPVLTDALVRATAFEEAIADWGKVGAPVLSECLAASGVLGSLQSIKSVSPISWFDVQSLFDPAQADILAKRLEGGCFLDLHQDVWLRAGIPTYLGPPRGSLLDRLFARHDVELIFPARMEFNDVKRWIMHMYECTDPR